MAAAQAQAAGTDTAGADASRCLSDSVLVAEANKVLPAVQVAEAVPKLPDILAHLVKCVEAAPQHAAEGKATANEKWRLALHLTAEERKECARTILAWYKRLQAAVKAAGKKP